MEINTDKNQSWDNLNNKGVQRNLKEKDLDEDEIEKEMDTPSQPAEEHLITEADDLHNNDLEQNPDESSLEDPDQESEGIDPVNHPRDFTINPEHKPNDL